MDLKEEARLGSAIDTHWYYLSKARMMADHVRKLTGGKPVKRVMDVGAGAGWFSRWMLREGLAESALCIDPGYENDRDEMEAGRKLLFRRELRGEDADLVLMMDVLEHVEDDVGLLSTYLDAVSVDTPIFITVPAFEMLWSAHDVYLEHHRRYTLKQLVQTIRSAEAEPLESHYFFGAIFPGVALVRLATRGRDPTRSDMDRTPGPVNALLKGVCSAERLVMRANRVAGVSAVAVCRRKAG